MLPGLSPVSGKRIVAHFDGGLLSSDASVLVLGEIEQGRRVAERLATCVVGPRVPELVTHGLADIIRFRLLMIQQRCGKIINISSQTGVIALDDHAAYASSKGGLNALTKSLCVEWAKHNIQVNAICPTVILTPMGRKIWGPPEKSGPMLKATPLGRFGEPTEIADMALYLASPASELVNGSILMIEGGYTSL